MKYLIFIGLLVYISCSDTLKKNGKLQILVKGENLQWILRKMAIIAQ